MKSDCLHCKGAGTTAGHNTKYAQMCKACLGDGWVDEEILESISDDYTEAKIRTKKYYGKVTFDEQLSSSGVHGRSSFVKVITED